MSSLGEIFTIQRRFRRSVNLERDGNSPDSLEGYVLTPRSFEVIERILNASLEPHRTRAWTLTGVYGTGKSSFANFASALFAAEDTAVRQASLNLLKDQGSSRIQKKAIEVPDEGLVRAVATGRREPLPKTVVRALARGAEEFWARRRGRKPNAVVKVLELRDEITQGHSIEADVASLTRQIAEASGSGLLLIIDELGKVLEHAGRTGGREDLFLLQQLAELPSGPDDSPVLVMGLLHQAFSEYGQRLSTAERAEWGKIQGRFEDVPFAEPADQMLRIMGHAIQRSDSAPTEFPFEDLAGSWSAKLSESMADPYVGEILTTERVHAVLPLHPVTALVLPTLCARYGQNERSLFTFLAGNEPHSLSRFLEEGSIPENGPIPLLRLPTLFDYFVDAARSGSGNRVQLTRWSEINTVIRDAKGLPVDHLDALKAIGTLNLISAGGPLRASKGLVLQALSVSPGDPEERKGWQKVLKELEKKRLVTYRTQVDEYRVWQGSDFDIDEAVREHTEGDRRGLAAILQALGAPSPVVAHRHSYQTGTLRFFERRYADEAKPLHRLKSAFAGSDGVIAYWVGMEPLEEVPRNTADGLPLVVLESEEVDALHSAASELAALLSIEKNEPALQSDGVARKELRERIGFARELLDAAVHQAFDQAKQRTTWAKGSPTNAPNFNGILSEILDETYSQGPTLWNEIINRRQLTSQGSKAQREVITALLMAPDEPRFGIEGTGADFSVYSSVFLASGIHCEEDGEWILAAPVDTSDVALTGVWKAIESFCLSAVEQPRSLDDLYQVLFLPPYGMREGLIPVLLAAVLMRHSEDVSVYQEGSFIPTLSPAHFELLVKRPEKFAVKHFDLGGVNFNDYRRVLGQLGSANAPAPSGIRNETLLNIVRPLIQFAVSLPQVTKRTRSLSEPAEEVREALLTSKEPDDLVFRALPEACGFAPFKPGEKKASKRRKQFLSDLTNVIRELRTHYDDLLSRCESLIHEGFGVRSGLENLREDLRVRAQYLVGSVIEPQLNSFVVAAADGEMSDRDWLESLVMIIADRPADTWTDENLTAFEINVGEMARRFANLEALQKEIAQAPQQGFDAKRVTITSPTGKETHRVVWVERDSREKILDQTDQMLAHLNGIGADHLKQAVLIQLLEQVLEVGSNQGTPLGPTSEDEEEIKYA